MFKKLRTGAYFMYSIVCLFFVLRVNLGLTRLLCWFRWSVIEYHSLPMLLLGFLSLVQISIFVLTAKRDISFMSRFFMSPLWHQVRECKHKGSFRCVDTSKALKICKQVFISWIKSIYTQRKIHLSEHTNLHLSLCALGNFFCCYFP